MKKIYFLFFFSVQVAHGQKSPYDSLELRLADGKTETQKLEILKQLVEVAHDNDIRKALEYAKRGVALAEKAGDKNWQPKFYEMQGRMHANLVQFDSAINFFNKAMTGFLAVNNKKGQATTSFKIAYVLKRTGETEKALEADLRALRLMEELDDKEGMAGAYERVSDDLTLQGRLAEAMDYAKKSIETCEKNNIKGELVYALFNAGNVSIAMGKAQQSLEYYNKSIDLARSLNFSNGTMAPMINSRGNALKRLGRYAAALEDYRKTLAISKETNFPPGISSAIANLGEVNLLMGNYKEALGYQLETVRLQEAEGDLSNLTENYGHVSTIYEKLGDYKQALAYQKKARLIRDSVASIKSDTAMSKLLTQYQDEKKEATIAAQQNQISQQKKVQWLSIGVAVLLAKYIFEHERH